jgi:hypothetical protein
MKRYLLALGFTIAAFTGCAVDPSTPQSTSDELAQPATDDTTSSESQAIEVPEALQPITNATCASQHGTGCLTPVLCQANGGSRGSDPGCTGKNICCHF